MRLCRICLQTKNIDNINLFSSDEEAMTILDKIYVCFQAIISDDKQFLYSMCNICLKELDSANNFRLKCLASNEKLKEMKLSINTTEHNLFDDDFDKDFMPVKSNDITKKLCKKPSNGVGSEISEKKNFKCDFCGKTLRSLEAMIRHQKIMHQYRKNVGKVTGHGATRRYYCTKCPYYTPHSQTLVNHIRKHSGERPYHCKCGKSFTQSSSLTTHSKTHSNATYYTCATCGHQFKHLSSLKKHMKVHEVGGFHCNVCLKQLKSKETLQAHLHRHFNIRNYNCEDCGDTFVTSSELINHRKIHNFDKNIECHLCGYKTHTKKVLTLHLKRHAGDKSFKCEICDVSCYTMGELRIHKRVHSREKPYPCPTCSQRFMHSTSVNKHMKNVHGISYKWGDDKHKNSRKIKL